MNSPPGPPNSDMCAVVHDFVDIAAEVGESGSEIFQLSVESVPAANRTAIEGNMRNKILGEYLRSLRHILSSPKENCKPFRKRIGIHDRLRRTSRAHKAQGDI